MGVTKSSIGLLHGLLKGLEFHIFMCRIVMCHIFFPAIALCSRIGSRFSAITANIRTETRIELRIM